MLYRNYNGIMLGYHRREKGIAAMMMADEYLGNDVSHDPTRMESLSREELRWRDTRRIEQRRVRSQKQNRRKKIRLMVMRELAKGYADVIL
jgi:hypothetical protein